MNPYVATSPSPGLDPWPDPRGAVARAQAFVDPAVVEEIAALFRLLADPTRTRLCYALLAAGELCVSDLAEVVGAPETSVSHALRLLRTAGVVRNRRVGRQVHYRLDDEHVRVLLTSFVDHVEHTGDPTRAGDELGPRPGRVR